MWNIKNNNNKKLIDTKTGFTIARVGRGWFRRWEKWVKRGKKKKLMPYVMLGRSLKVQTPLLRNHIKTLFETLATVFRK